MQFDNLYKNYAGESRPKKSKKIPKKDYFRLDEKLYERILEDALLENVNDVIDDRVGEHHNVNCVVQ